MSFDRSGISTVLIDFTDACQRTGDVLHYVGSVALAFTAAVPDASKLDADWRATYPARLTVLAHA